MSNHNPAYWRCNSCLNLRKSPPALLNKNENLQNLRVFQWPVDISAALTSLFKKRWDVDLIEVAWQLHRVNDFAFLKWWFFFLIIFLFLLIILTKVPLDGFKGWDVRGSVKFSSDYRDQKRLACVYLHWITVENQSVSCILQFTPRQWYLSNSHKKQNLPSLSRNAAKKILVHRVSAVSSPMNVSE